MSWIIQSTPSWADILPIVTEEWLIEIGFMNYHYGTGISEWSLNVIPSRMIVLFFLGALDAQTRLMMQENLRSIWKKFGTTVVFVTHDVDEAVFLADRVLVMSAAPGRIIRDLKIDLPRPRDPEMVVDPVYIAAKKEYLQYIRAESLRQVTTTL